MERQPVVVKIISPFLFAFSAFALCFGAPMSWVDRDGVAPGYIPSQGQEAVAKFTEMFSDLLLFCGVIFVLALLPCVLSAFIQMRHRNSVGFTKGTVRGG
ncbi:hypothetical protein IAD21_00755 [Abditibacteriota bacterium]|nr:hypothetical protein IAD21_00755 [Abditibacteriota bacterium]